MRRSLLETTRPEAPEASPEPAPRASPGALFPRLICRTAGLPVSSLESLRASESLEIWKRIRRLEKKLEERRDGLVAGLFEAIGRSEDPAERRPLLEIKRDVHNLRPLRAAVAGNAKGTELREGVEEYQKLQKALESAHLELVSTYEREILAARRGFQELVLGEDFRRGLLLSSRTLAMRLPSYSRTAADRLGAKGRQVERSLMRYFSRMVMKPTPFGTFCSLLAGHLEGNEGGSRARFSRDPLRKATHLRLNKTIYGRLLPLMVQRPAIRRQLPVELNPTLQMEGDKWVFLAAAGGAEVFQRLPQNPVLHLFRQLLTEQGPKPLAVLVTVLASHPQLEATAQEAEAFVLELLDMGFLRYRVGISEQEVDWDEPLRSLLSGVDDDHGKAIVTFLEALRLRVERYQEAGLGQRLELLEEAVALVRKVFEDLGEPIAEKDPVLGQMPPFFEDSGGEAQLRLDAGSFAEDLRDYVERSLPMTGARSEQANMRHFFDGYYGPRGKARVPLLRFYEDYFREHFKGHLERQRPSKQEEAAEDSEPYDLSNPFGLEFLTQLQRSRMRLQERIRELWRNAGPAEAIELSPEDLDLGSEGLPAMTDRCRSVSVFGHLLEGWGGEGESALMTGHCLVGFGKYFSRFLYLLPESLKEALRESNRHLTREAVAEICGDASFNANLHPPLLPWEISYPTGESGAAEEQILGSEIWVEPVPFDPHRLRLRRGPEGPEVIPVDLGFLNPRMRPPLFQLLSRFSPPATFSLPFPESPVSRHEGSPSETADDPSRQSPLPSPSSKEIEEPASPRVQVRPRITYGRLILARRRWKVFSGDLPRRRKGEEEAEYFLRLQEWRELAGLPVEIFVKVQALPPKPPPQTPTPGADEPPPRIKPRQRVREHLYKPQYIDFSSPILVDLFSRLGEGLEAFFAIFEECLPAREHMAKAGGEGIATELLLQIDFPEAAGGGSS